MIRSHLACRAPSGFGPDDAARSQRLCAEAWRTRGIAVLRADDPELSWEQRAMLCQIAERKFGKRNTQRAA